MPNRRSEQEIIGEPLIRPFFWNVLDLTCSYAPPLYSGSTDIHGNFCSDASCCTVEPLLGHC